MWAPTYTQTDTHPGTCTFHKKKERAGEVPIGVRVLCQLELDPWNADGWRGQPTPPNCLLTSIMCAVTKIPGWNVMPNKSSTLVYSVAENLMQNEMPEHFKCRSVLTVNIKARKYENYVTFQNRLSLHSVSSTER